MLFSDFERIAIAKIGFDLGWKREFASQAGLRSYLIIQRWKDAGYVPEDVADYLTKLKPGKAQFINQKWTATDYLEIARLYELGLPDTRIRDLMSKRLGREVTEGNIKHAKRNIRRGVSIEGKPIPRVSAQKRNSVRHEVSDTHQVLTVREQALTAREQSLSAEIDKVYRLLAS